MRYRISKSCVLPISASCLHRRTVHIYTKTYLMLAASLLFRSSEPLVFPVGVAMSRLSSQETNMLGARVCCSGRRAWLLVRSSKSLDFPVLVATKRLSSKYHCTGGYNLQISSSRAHRSSSLLSSSSSWQ